nr:NeuD/PglB/VioB family sugar acetyltransferase [Pantoea formicae]
MWDESVKLAIYGAGGMGREVLILARQIHQDSPRWDDIVFIDDIAPGRVLKGVPVMSFEQAIAEPIEVAIAVGEPALRAKLANKVREQGISLATLIHPDIVVSDCTRIGAGCVLAKGVFLSCDVTLGENSCMQAFSSVGHDAYIGNDVVISTYVTTGGNVKVHDRVFIGMSAVIQEKVNVGADTIIGMGAAVFNDIAASMIALGNPARVMRKNDEKRVFK